MIGSLFEIALPDGFAYARLNSTHPVYGDVLLVDQRRYEKQLDDLGVIDCSTIVVFPLSAAVAKGTLKARQIESATTARGDTPIFKFAVRDAEGGAIYWWLWDGEGIKIAGDDVDLSLLPERRALSQSQFLAVWDRP